MVRSREVLCRGTSYLVLSCGKCQFWYVTLENKGTIAVFLVTYLSCPKAGKKARIMVRGAFGGHQVPGEQIFAQNSPLFQQTPTDDHYFVKNASSANPKRNRVRAAAGILLFIFRFGHTLNGGSRCYELVCHVQNNGAWIDKRIFIELMTPDRKLKATFAKSARGSKTSYKIDNDARRALRGMEGIPPLRG